MQKRRRELRGEVKGWKREEGNTREERENAKREGGGERAVGVDERRGEEIQQGRRRGEVSRLKGMGGRGGRGRAPQAHNCDHCREVALL